MSIGHENTYADISWIKLIQFIGDNIGNNKYLDFTHTILTHITSLHPYFIRAYEMDLIMAPLIYPDSSEDTIRKHEKLIRSILDHGEKGIQTLCKKEILATIGETPIGTNLWKRMDLRNPCSSGMIPYYMGYHYNNVFHDGGKAEYYYKIASMQDDAPKASQFLAILAKSSEGNYRDSALSFLLVASDGYDKYPYTCRKLATNLAEDLLNKKSLSNKWIHSIELQEKNLKNSLDPKNPESYGANNCFDSIERGIKQLYIYYISEIAKDYPDITDSKTLEKKNIIPHTPTIQSQKNFYIKKVDNLWRYKTDTPI
jgi:hypothetical protein